MKSYTLRFVIGIIVLLVATQVLFSQGSTESHKVGLSASLQGSQMDFLIPIWIGSKATIAPIFGIIWIEDAGTDLHFGIASKFYFSRNDVSPFFGFRVGLLRMIPHTGDGTTDWLFGISLGGEYFFDENFSIGIEPQFNYTKSDERSTRFGNPGKSNINTAVALFASIYF